VASYTLKGRAALRGITYGGAVQYDPLQQDPSYKAAVLREMQLLVPENELKWDALRPTPTTFDFHKADVLLGFAQKNGKKLRGHCLAWHNQLPSWFSTTVNASNARQFLIDHITTVVGRYAGKMHSWDVANEQIETWETNVDGLRPTPWFNMLGYEYMDLAFRTTHQADPNAVLVYNEYSLELNDDFNEARRQRVIRLLQDFRIRGTPIHALGLQSHISPEAPFDASIFLRFLDQVAAMGYAIYISEMDVIDKTFPADFTTRDKLVADIYKAYWTAALSHPAVKVAVTWGITDRYSWLNYFDGSKRPDGLPSRGLVLDQNYQKKPAYNALLTALGSAPLKG
jgi:endo-1,4-beta-xylanase